jgi:hypothetical protein
MSVSKVSGGGDNRTADQLIEDAGKFHAPYEEIALGKGGSTVLYHPKGKTEQEAFEKNGFVHVKGVRVEKTPLPGVDASIEKKVSFEGYVDKRAVPQLENYLKSESPRGFIRETPSARLDNLTRNGSPGLKFTARGEVVSTQPQAPTQAEAKQALESKVQLARRFGFDRTTISLKDGSKLTLIKPLTENNKKNLLANGYWEVKGVDVKTKQPFSGLVHDQTIVQFTQTYSPANQQTTVAQTPEKTQAPAKAEKKTQPEVPTHPERRAISVKDGKILFAEPKPGSGIEKLYQQDKAWVAVSGKNAQGKEVKGFIPKEYKARFDAVYNPRPQEAVAQQSKVPLLELKDKERTQIAFIPRSNAKEYASLKAAGWKPVTGVDIKTGEVKEGLVADKTSAKKFQESFPTKQQYAALQKQLKEFKQPTIASSKAPEPEAPVIEKPEAPKVATGPRGVDITPPGSVTGRTSEIPPTPGAGDSEKVERPVTIGVGRPTPSQARPATPGVQVGPFNYTSGHPTHLARNNVDGDRATGKQISISTAKDRWLKPVNTPILRQNQNRAESLWLQGTANITVDPQTGFVKSVNFTDVKNSNGIDRDAKLKQVRDNIHSQSRWAPGVETVTVPIRLG